MKFSTVIWILTGGLQFVVGWWYRKSAVFYVPPGWFGPLTWWLSFPFAPAGSVSCGVWQMACRRVIKVGERVFKEVMEGEILLPHYSVNLDPGSWSLWKNDFSLYSFQDQQRLPFRQRRSSETSPIRNVHSFVNEIPARRCIACGTLIVIDLSLASTVSTRMVMTEHVPGHVIISSWPPLCLQ